MVVKIVAEWVEATELGKETGIRKAEVMVLRSGDNVLAIVKKLDTYEKSWRIVEMCGRLVSDDGSIGEIYFDTYGEVIEAVKSHFARQ